MKNILLSVIFLYNFYLEMISQFPLIKVLIILRIWACEHNFQLTQTTSQKVIAYLIP